MKQANEIIEKELLLFFCKQQKRIEEILSEFAKIGISGSTVIDGHGMGEIVADEIPVFSGLRNLFPKGNFQTHILMSVLSKESLQDVILIIKETCGDLCEPGSGVIVTLPVSRAIGLADQHNV